MFVTTGSLNFAMLPIFLVEPNQKMIVDSLVNVSAFQIVNMEADRVLLSAHHLIANARIVRIKLESDALQILSEFLVP